MDIKNMIELLNEFETPHSGVVFKSYDDYDGTFYGVDCDGETEIARSDSMILSKRFQFVEWLVDNNKIDTMKLEKIGYEKTVYEVYGQYKKIVEYSDYESLLMLLSIQDNPVEFILSILK